MLSKRHQQVLEEIEHDLRRSDAPLVSRFVRFRELVADEAMPSREELQPAPWRRPTAISRLSRRIRQAAGPDVGPRALLLIPVLILAIACMLLLILPLGQRDPTCRQMRQGAAASAVASGAPPAQQLPHASSGCAPRAAPGRHR